jgi:hypothetical protein
MILTITIDTSGREFCCGRAGATCALILGKLALNPILLTWSGHASLSIPVLFNGKQVGIATALKAPVEPTPKSS